MDYYKAVYVSALTGKRVNAILDNVDEVYKKRIPKDIDRDTKRSAS